MAEQAQPSTTATQGTPSAPPGTNPPPQGIGGGGIADMLLMLGPMFVIFYLLVIRPQNKERQAKEALLAKLSTKDKVITVFGVYGTVMEIDGDDVVLLVDQKKDVKIKVRRSAVESILPDSK